MAYFPEKIWDGTSRSRPNLQGNNPPDIADYLQTIMEIQALQQYVLNLTNNVKIMPDFGKIMSDCDEKINELSRKLDSFSPPVDLQEKVAEIDRRLIEIDPRAEISALKNYLNLLQTQNTSDRLVILEIKKQIATDILSFQNKMRNDFEQYKRDTATKFDQVAQSIEQLNKMLSIATLVEKLQK